MSWPYRNYLPPIGRWTQQEKLGIIPNDNGEINPYDPIGQYRDGLNLYEALASNPIISSDLYGLECGVYAYMDPPNPWWLVMPHFGFFVDGKDVDYGPGGSGGKGKCVYGSETDPDDAVSVPLLKRNIGTMKAGPKKGCKCKCVTCEDVKACIWEKCKDWNGTTYRFGLHDCLDFVNSTRWKCCLW